MSSHSRNGKIARLPKALREEINQRFDEGATATSLVEWLNGLPEVQALIASQFEGHPILEQNLSQWKKGGYQDWLRQQEAMEVVERLYERAQELKEQGQAENHPPVSQVLSHWLGARYVVATREVEAAEGPEAWRMLRQMCGDVVKLRRMEQQDRRLELDHARVEIEREQLQLDRERAEAEREERKRRRFAVSRSRDRRSVSSPGDADFEDENDPDRPWEDWNDEERLLWARRPENFERIEALTNEQRVARWKAFLGISPNSPHPMNQRHE